jgi:peptidoglycan/LPS O-acetylase OafA/YrhL
LLASSSSPSTAPAASSQPHGTAGRQDYLPQLDAVRGIACLLVLVAHLKAVRGLHWLDDKLGTIGVGLFFAMSGFLITRILIADKRSGRGLNAFYNRRAARIFPIYFLLLVVLWFVWPSKEICWVATFTFNLHYLTGVREYFHVDAGDSPIPPVAHFWSLCVEEHFYWFWPALVWLLPARLYRWLPLVCIAATPPVTYLLLGDLKARGFQEASIEGLISRLTLTQMVALSFGAILAVHERLLLARSIRIIRVRFSPLLIVGLFSLLLSVGGWLARSAWASTERTGLAWESTLLDLGCGGLLALGLCCPALDRARGLNTVGRISYGLYLFHLPIYAALGLAQSTAGLPRWRGVAAVLSTFAVAAVSFRLVEAPLLGWVRQNQHRLGLRWGRVSLSLGSALALGFAVIVVWQMVGWVRGHPRIPEEMRYGAVVTDSGTTGFYWMGIHHDLDANGFRRHTPFPAKTPGLPRVAIVGDSYTFGQCVESDQVLSAVAERIVRGRGVEVEVLNLGKCGAQAEDVLRTIQDTALSLQCQVIVYAATVDDFVPGGEGSDKYTVKQFLSDPAFAQRFRKAIRAMQAACTAKGVILRVIPFTQETNNAETIAAVRLIQSLCRQEGIALIDIDAYLRDNAHRHFEFNHLLDGHPNAECHRLHGAMIAQELLRLHASGALFSDPAPAVPAAESFPRK